MTRIDQAKDPAIHETAQKIAGRFVWMIQRRLRNGERKYALEAAYTVVKEELEAAKRKAGL